MQLQGGSVLWQNILPKTVHSTLGEDLLFHACLVIILQVMGPQRIYFSVVHSFHLEDKVNLVGGDINRHIRTVVRIE